MMRLKDEEDTTEVNSYASLGRPLDECSPIFWVPERVSEPGPWAGHIPFAFWIISASRPRRLVELGTHSGNSYLAFCQAVKRLELSTACYAIDTWQGDEHSGRYGEEIFHELSIYHDQMYSSFSQLLRMTFDDGVQYFSDRSIDLLHIDGCHTYEAAKHDFYTWLPKLSSRALVLMHDVNVREREFGVCQLWDELAEKYPAFSFLHSHGLGVLAVGSQVPEGARVLFNEPQDGTIKCMRESCATLGAAIRLKLNFAQREAELKSHHQQLEKVNAMLAQRECELANVQRELTERERELNERDEQLKSLNATLSEIVNSRSWRYLRKIQSTFCISPRD
jgi:hypothetical protein